MCVNKSCVCFTSTRAHVRVFSRSLCHLEAQSPRAQRTSASATIARTSCFINVHHTTPKLKKKYFSYLGIKSNLRSATDMDDQDLSVLDSRLPFEQMLTATPHRYIHLKGNLVPAFVDNKTHLSFLDISVDFIKERPTSDIELVFKDGAGDKQQSKKFRKSVPIYWSLNMSVHAISIIILRY